jgi:hypothetical protein
VTEQNVIDLGHGHQMLLLVEKVDGHRAEGAAEFDHPGLGRHIGQAWRQEAERVGGDPLRFFFLQAGGV